MATAGRRFPASNLIGAIRDCLEFLAPGRAALPALSLALPGVAAAGSVRTLQEIEREYIAAVLRANDGNRTRTARQLGIGAAMLYRKIKEYQLPAARD